MSFEAEFFKKKRVILDQLVPFGFIKEDNAFVYRETIMADSFQVDVNISSLGQVTGNIRDLDTGEDYLLFRIEGQRGSFVGQVREAYSQVLEKIATACFEETPFLHQQSNRLARRLTHDLGDSYDQPFAKYPEYLSYRIRGKWYALIFPIKMAKLGDFPKEIAEQEVEVVNLKVNPSEINNWLNQEGIYPSYHMSKKSWVSVVLNDTVTDEVLWELVLTSRQLATPANVREAGKPQFWIIPANPKYYDIDREFAENKRVTWRQKAKVQSGDYVFIYITAPIKALRYACKVLDGPPEKEDSTVTLELIKRYDDKVFSFETLKHYGVSAVRSARRLPESLIKELEKDLALL